MKHWTIGTAALLATAIMGAPAIADTVTLELWSRADPSGPLRPGNVVKAAERLNEALKKEGSSDQVEVTIRD
jgi:inositol-phosphate transport system substrate-binding protein